VKSKSKNIAAKVPLQGTGLRGPSWKAESWKHRPAAPKNKHAESKKIAVKENKIEEVFARDKSEELDVRKQNAEDDDNQDLHHHHHQEQARRGVCCEKQI
jgi:hypothetical protein